MHLITNHRLDVKKGQLGNLRTTYGVRLNESVNEAEFKHINKDEHAIKLAIKDVEKKARLKANRDKPLEYEQLSLNKIMLSKVLGREKLGKEHQAAWKKLKKEYSLKESVTDASNNLEKIFGTDQETMDMFQGIEDKGTVKDMIEFIDEFGNEEALSRYGIKSTAQVKKLAKTIMNESYKGTKSDFMYDLELALDNIGISRKAMKKMNS